MYRLTCLRYHLKNTFYLIDSIYRCFHIVFTDIPVKDNNECIDTIGHRPNLPLKILCNMRPVLPWRCSRLSRCSSSRSWYSSSSKLREAGIPSDALPRSEEHTSELQSPCKLVCRL